MCEKTTHDRGVYTAEVITNKKLCDEHYLLQLRLGEFPPSVAGQFVQLQLRGLEAPVDDHVVDWPEGQWPHTTQPELAGKETLLRRPFSLAGQTTDEQGVLLDIIYRVVGTGTSWLAEVRPGRAISVLGPLGHCLPIIEDKQHAVLIGGGVGIPPMMYLAEALNAAGKTAVAFNGVRTKSLLPLTAGAEPANIDGKPNWCVQEFTSRGTTAVIASDDGSVGYHGLITEALERWVEKSGIDRTDLVAYSCGPEPMMRAVGELCLARGITCYLSLERSMACGMGTCQSCIVKIRDDSEQGWSYKLCCTHGPVFEAGQIVWD